MSARSEVPPSSLPDAVERVARAVVTVHGGRRSLASGTALGGDRIITAAHALPHHRTLTVLSGSGAFSATLIGADPATDLALLAVEGYDGVALPPAPVPVRMGDFVFALARDPGGEPSASFGYVGRTGKAWQTWRGGVIDRLIQLDGGLYGGFSGGPIAAPDGRWIGVGTAGLTRGPAVVIPVETVERIAAQLGSEGRVLRAYLGIVVQAATFGENEQGVLVTSIGADSPAARGRLLVGDILTALDGRPLVSPEDLQAILGSVRPGADVKVVGRRGGAPLELVLAAGERPTRSC